MSDTDNSPFMQIYTGYLKGVMQWSDLDALWQTLRTQAGNNWYVYAVGETPPSSPTEPERLITFIDEIDKLLRTDHHEDYCGIVYTDDPSNPSLIKIFDPNNLGSSCGPGFGYTILPGWILSTVPPDDLQAAFPQPGNRQRWWQRIFG